MTDLAVAAETIRRHAPNLARRVATSFPLGSPLADVANDLRFVCEVLAAALELGSCGMFDRTLAWLKVRTRALGGDVEALTQVPEALAEMLRPELDADAASALAQLLDNAATFVRFARTTNPVGHDPLLQPGTCGHDFLAAAMTGDRLRAQAAARRAGALDAALRTVIEPAQREVGRMWQNGLLAPPDEHLVSQVVFHVVTTLALEQPRPAADAPLVAMVRAHGDEHALGQLCAEAHVRGVGLRTRVVGAPADAQRLPADLEPLAPAAIAFTCTTAAQARYVARAIAAVRRSPALAHCTTLLGGPLILDVPQLPTQLGADGGAYDGAMLALQLQQQLAAR